MNPMESQPSLPPEEKGWPDSEHVKGTTKEETQKNIERKRGPFLDIVREDLNVLAENGWIPHEEISKSLREAGAADVLLEDKDAHLYARLSAEKPRDILLYALTLNRAHLTPEQADAKRATIGRLEKDFDIGFMKKWRPEDVQRKAEEFAEADGTNVETLVNILNAEPEER